LASTSAAASAKPQQTEQRHSKSDLPGNKLAQITEHTYSPTASPSQLDCLILYLSSLLSPYRAAAAVSRPTLATLATIKHPTSKLVSPDI
jgi:hypothetical protein